MGHQDQDGEKVEQMPFFVWKLEAAMDREKQKNNIFKSYYLILSGAISKIQVSAFRRNLGYAQSVVFFQNFQNTVFYCFFTQFVQKLQQWW